MPVPPRDEGSNRPADLRPGEAALAAAIQGWSVFPLQPMSKVPLRGLRWQERSTDDAGRIESYAARAPDANWACDLGKSGLLVLDVDCKRKQDDGYVFDPAGYDSLCSLLAGHEEPYSCSILSTGNGGMHWWLRQPTKPLPGRTARGFLPLIDVKSAGGYALLPGSWIPPSITHPQADGTYRCEGLLLVAQEMPGWLEGALRPQRPQRSEGHYARAMELLSAARRGSGGARAHLARLAEEVAMTRAPGRNDALNSAAFKMRDEVAGGLIAAREVCSALLSACRANGLEGDDGERACLATIASGLGMAGGAV